MTPLIPDKTIATIEFLLGMLAVFTVIACISAAALYYFQIGIIQ